MGVEVSIVPATHAHALALAPLIRKEDAAELEACGFESPLEALLEGLNGSDEAYALLFDGEVGALFGVASVQETSTGIAWALTGRAVSRHRLAFLRASRQVLDELLKRWHRLVNFVDARYAGALWWAAWLGFTVSPPRPHGPEGEPFCFILIGGT